MRGTFLYLTDEWPISRDALRALGAVEAVVRSGSASRPTYSVRLPDGRMSMETLTDDEAGQHVSQVAAWIASAEEGGPTRELLAQLAEFERVLLIEGTAKGGDEAGLRRFLTRLATLRDGRILHGNALYDLDGACLFGEDTAPDWFSDEPGGDPEAESYTRRQATLAVLAREGFPTADSAVHTGPGRGSAREWSSSSSYRSSIAGSNESPSSRGSPGDGSQAEARISRDAGMMLRTMSGDSVAAR